MRSTVHWQVYATLNSVPMIHSIGSSNSTIFRPCLVYYRWGSLLHYARIKAMIKKHETEHAWCNTKFQHRWMHLKGYARFDFPHSLCIWPVILFLIFFFSMVALKLISPGNQNTCTVFIYLFFKSIYPKPLWATLFLPERKKKERTKKQRTMFVHTVRAMMWFRSSRK